MVLKLIRPNTSAGRRGLTLIEVAVAQHRGAQRKRCALEAASAVLDSLSAREWNAVTQQTASNMHLEPETLEFLIDPRLMVTVVEEPGPLAAKRLIAEVGWPEGGRRESVQLSTWVYRRGSGP
jgi:hypothetical protein